MATRIKGSEAVSFEAGANTVFTSTAVLKVEFVKLKLLQIATLPI
jgi:hypothetical protein